MAHDKAFLICENKCLVPGYSKEQIDELLERGSLSLIDKRTGEEFSLWVGTKAQYDALAVHDSHTIYIKTDDDTVESAENAGHADEADIALSLNDLDVGGNQNPVYFDDGVPVACNALYLHNVVITDTINSQSILAVVPSASGEPITTVYDFIHNCLPMATLTTGPKWFPCSGYCKYIGNISGIYCISRTGQYGGDLVVGCYNDEIQAGTNLNFGSGATISDIVTRIR